MNVLREYSSDLFLCQICTVTHLTKHDPGLRITIEHSICCYARVKEISIHLELQAKYHGTWRGVESKGKKRKWYDKQQPIGRTSFHHSSWLWSRVDTGKGSPLKNSNQKQSTTTKEYCFLSLHPSRKNSGIEQNVLLTTCSREKNLTYFCTVKQAEKLFRVLSHLPWPLRH